LEAEKKCSNQIQHMIFKPY